MLDPGCQKEVLNCVEAVVSKTGINHTLVGCRLFNVLLNVLSLCEHKDRVRGLMDQLSNMLGMGDRLV